MEQRGGHTEWLGREVQSHCNERRQGPEGIPCIVQVSVKRGGELSYCCRWRTGVEEVSGPGKQG